MRKIIIALAASIVIALATVPAGTADHDPPFTDTQTLVVQSGVLWWVAPTLTELLTDCDVNSPFNGIEGWMYDLNAIGANDGDHEFFVTTSDPLDIDVKLFDQDCNETDSFGECFFETGLGDDDPFGDCAEESGKIAAGDHYLLVWNFHGAGTYTLTIQ